MNDALRYALLLLKFRPRSEYELHQRLKRKGYPEPVIKEALPFLKEKGLIDDLEFARIWVSSRIKKPLGIRRIKQELKLKGVEEDLIEQAIESLGDKYSEEETIKELLCSRWKKLKHVEPHKAKRRLFLYLLRRGFSSDMIQEAISQIRSNE
jgi:regulatory protein